MKTSRFLAALLAFIATSAIAQIPQNIESAFKDKYPNAKVKKFNHRHNEYVVTFADKGEKCKAIFGQNGNWIETNVNVKWDKVPVAVKTGLKKNQFNGWYIGNINLIEKPGSKVYAVQVDRNTTFIGLGGYENVYFTSSGNLVK